MVSRRAERVQSVGPADGENRPDGRRVLRGYQLLGQTDASRASGLRSSMGDHLAASQAPQLAAKRLDGMGSVRHRPEVAYRILDLGVASMQSASSSSVSPSRSVMKP